MCVWEEGGGGGGHIPSAIRTKRMYVGFLVVFCLCKMLRSEM